MDFTTNNDDDDDVNVVFNCGNIFIGDLLVINVFFSILELILETAS